MLKGIGAYEDIEKVKASRSIRAGQGKMRNRRYVQKRGPLIVYKSDGKTMMTCFAFSTHNLLCQIDRAKLIEPN